MKHLAPEQLSACLDNELRGQAQEEAKAHLASCPECREELAQLAALEKLTQGAEPAPADEAYFAVFSERVMQGIEKERPVPLAESLREWFKKLTAVPVFRLQVIGGVAFAGLVIGFGIYLYQRPYLVQPSLKGVRQEPHAALKTDTPLAPAVTATPSGDLTLGSGDAGTGESLAFGSRLERPMAEVGRGGREGYLADGRTTMAGKPAEAERRPLEAGAEKGLTSATETVAADKVVSLPEERKDESGEKDKKNELAKLQPEVTTTTRAPSAGAAGAMSPAPAKEEGPKGKLAEPSLRARSGEKVSDDEYLFAEAQTKQSNRAYGDAARDYDSLVRNYPKSARLDDAHYNLALSEYANSQQTRARGDVERALNISRVYLKAARDSARKSQVNRQVMVLERQIKEIK